MLNFFLELYLTIISHNILKDIYLTDIFLYEYVSYILNGNS